jgi:hypothetical protein
MTGDGKLEIRPVEIAWRRPADVLVTAGLEAGDKLVTSTIPAPVAGMTLRARGETEQAKASPEGARKAGRSRTTPDAAAKPSGGEAD